MLRRACTLMLCMAATAGCANHVRFADEMRDRETRDVTAAVTRIDPRERVLAGPYAEVAVRVDETVRIRRRETIVRLDEETPWLAREELWEVPVGVVAVPLFIGVRASDKMFLGLIPDRWIEGGLDFGFSALNPALNVESEDRVVGREVSRKSRELERGEERVTRALANSTVSISLSGGPTQAVAVDSSGR